MNHHEQSRVDERLSIATDAAEWLTRLRTADARVQREFLSWLKRSPVHVHEIVLAARTDAELREFLGEHSAEVTALRALQEPKRRRYRAWAAGFAALLLVAILIGSLASPDASVYTTGGDLRAVALADGSSIFLNRDSRVRVSLSKRQREVYLLDGQALFTVARDEARPFQVHVADSVVRAVGTQFDVHRLANTCQIAVLDGVVQIANRITGTYPRQVAAKEGVSIGATGLITAAAPIDIEKVSDWRRVIFHDKPLAEIVAEMARLNPPPKPQLRVEGAELQARRFSVDFRADDPEGLALYVTKDDDTIALTRNDNEIVLKLRTDPASPIG
jgi:transmembrane sensor